MFVSSFHLVFVWCTQPLLIFFKNFEAVGEHAYPQLPSSCRSNCGHNLAVKGGTFDRWPALPCTGAPGIGSGRPKHHFIGQLVVDIIQAHSIRYQDFDWWGLAFCLRLFFSVTGALAWNSVWGHNLTQLFRSKFGLFSWIELATCRVDITSRSQMITKPN